MDGHSSPGPSTSQGPNCRGIDGLDGFFLVNPQKNILFAAVIQPYFLIILAKKEWEGVICC